MIEAYLRRLDELLSAHAFVQGVEIVRRSIRAPFPERPRASASFPWT